MKEQKVELWKERMKKKRIRKNQHEDWKGKNTNAKLLF